jgi:hypothetical protein
MAGHEAKMQPIPGGILMRALALVLISIFVSGAWAASESTTTLPVDETEATPSSSSSSSELKNILRDKHFDEDKRINDLELRADGGSLNRYSTQFIMSYSGSAVNDLSNPQRPNPNNSPGDMRTFASGSANVRYRVSQDVGMNFGTGVVFFAPYQQVAGQDPQHKAGQSNYGVSNPQASIDKNYVVTPEVQSRSQLALYEITDQGYKAGGEWGEAAIRQFFKYNPGHSRVILGFSVEGDWFTYARDYQPKIPSGPGKTSGDGNTSRYYITMIPSFEYKLTDTVNFNTSIGYAEQNFRAAQSWWNWNHPLSTWRVGAGWAITHDIYINPYLNFYMESPAFSTASLNINTVFSIF